MSNGACKKLKKLQQKVSSLVPDDFLPVLALAPYVPLDLIPPRTLDFEALNRSGIVQTGPDPAAWREAREREGEIVHPTLDNDGVQLAIRALADGLAALAFQAQPVSNESSQFPSGGAGARD